MDPQGSTSRTALSQLNFIFVDSPQPVVVSECHFLGSC